MVFIKLATGFWFCVIHSSWFSEHYSILKNYCQLFCCVASTFLNQIYSERWVQSFLLLSQSFWSHFALWCIISILTHLYVGFKVLEYCPWAFLVAQRLRIHLPMQGTQVQALVHEDPTCRRATKPMHHNYWVYALEPASHSYWSPRSATREATATRIPRTATKSSSRWPQLEKAHAQQWRPNAAINK